MKRIPDFSLSLTVAKAGGIIENYARFAKEGRLFTGMCQPMAPTQREGVEGA